MILVTKDSDAGEPVGAEALARLAPEPDETIYLTADEVRKTAVPNTEPHAAALTEAGWEFHANDHDTVVFRHPELGDEVRVWDDGAWIRYSKAHAFVSQGVGSDSLRQSLGQAAPPVLFPAMQKSVQEIVDEAVAKVREEFASQPRVAKTTVVEKHVVRGADNRITKVIETHREEE